MSNCFILYSQRSCKCQNVRVRERDPLAGNLPWHFGKVLKPRRSRAHGLDQIYVIIDCPMEIIYLLLSVSNEMLQEPDTKLSFSSVPSPFRRPHHFVSLLWLAKIKTWEGKKDSSSNFMNEFRIELSGITYWIRYKNLFRVQAVSFIILFLLKKIFRSNQKTFWVYCIFFFSIFGFQKYFFTSWNFFSKLNFS